MKQLKDSDIFLRDYGKIMIKLVFKKKSEFWHAYTIPGSKFMSVCLSQFNSEKKIEELYAKCYVILVLTLECKGDHSARHAVLYQPLLILFQSFIFINLKNGSYIMHQVG